MIRVSPKSFTKEQKIKCIGSYILYFLIDQWLDEWYMFGCHLFYMDTKRENNFKKNMGKTEPTCDNFLY